MYPLEEKIAAVDLYFKSHLSCRQLIEDYSLPFSNRIFNDWVRADPRCTRAGNVIFPPEVKLKAMALLQAGKIPREICDILSLTSPSLVRSWKRLYKLRGDTAFMPQKPVYPKRKKQVARFPKPLERATDSSLAEQLEQLTFENDCLQAEIDFLKKYKGSVKKNRESISNKGKTLMIASLSPQYTLVRLCEHFKLALSSYHYCISHHQNSKWALVDAQIIAFIEKNDWHKSRSGYRKVLIDMAQAGIVVAERRVRAVMKVKHWGLEQYKSMKHFHSYKKDGHQPVTNYLYDCERHEHYFKPARPHEILSTDVTEVHINGFKLFLSVILDLFDSTPTAFSISRRPDMALMTDTLEQVIKKRPKGSAFVLHSDQGSVYRSSTWKALCQENHILQSMSRKGKSGDNAAVEGFFGRLKQEWFNHSDFTKMSYEAVKASLEAYLHWFNEKRIHNTLKMTPQAYHHTLELQLLNVS